MGSSRIFAAVNSKISGMGKNLLTDADFDVLMEMDNRDDIVQYLLKNSYYSDLPIKKEGYIFTEQILKRKIMKDIDKLSNFMDSKYKVFFEGLKKHYEYNDIKTILRSIIRRENIDDLNDRLIVLNNGTDINIDTSTSLEDFINSLSSTRYYDLLVRYLDEDLDKILFYMEMNLDRDYYIYISELSKSLKREDSKIFNDYMGEHIDLLNIEWIYRAIKFFNLPREIVFNFTIIGGKNYSLKDLNKMSYMSVEELRDYVLKGKYKFLFDSEHDIDLYMERRIERYLYYKAKDYMRSTKMNISKTIGYLLLREFEIKDITTVIEKTKFELSKEEAMAYLIRTIERK
ncbi:MAG: V-type ATPase subunit [Tissierellia bacterium]|nr:V-type ATPase subunit [Tissierellia bacterium]